MITKEEEKGIAELLSSRETINQKIGILLASSQGMRVNKIAELFFLYGDGWEYSTNYSTNKTKEIKLDSTYSDVYIKALCGNLFEFEFVYNNIFELIFICIYVNGRCQRTISTNIHNHSLKMISLEFMKFAPKYVIKIIKREIKKNNPSKVIKYANHKRQ